MAVRNNSSGRNPPTFTDCFAAGSQPLSILHHHVVFAVAGGFHHADQINRLLSQTGKDIDTFPAFGNDRHLAHVERQAQQIARPRQHRHRLVLLTV